MVLLCSTNDTGVGALTPSAGTVLCPYVTVDTWSILQPDPRPELALGVFVKLTPGLYDQTEYSFNCEDTHGMIVDCVHRRFNVHWFADPPSVQTYSAKHVYAVRCEECPNLALESSFPAALAQV